MRSPSPALSALALPSLSELVLALRLGLQDLRLRYRRTVIGPIWMTISILITAFGLGYMWGTVFRIDLTEYLPFLLSGLIAWNLLASFFNEGFAVYTTSEGLIRNVNNSLLFHVLRSLWRALIVFAHTLIAWPVIYFFFPVPITPAILLFFPALALYVVFGFGIIIIFGALCTRWRDITPIAGNLLQLAFLFSPIFWRPHQLNPDHWALRLNPFVPLLEIMRNPLRGLLPSSEAWVSSVAITAAVLIIALVVHLRTRRKVVFWL